MKTLILWLVFLIMMVGCSRSAKQNYTIRIINGVKVYKNSNIPSEEALEILPREIFRIEGMAAGSAGSDREFAWPRFLDIDSAGNIYIVDTASAAVKKFDQNGNFITSFGRKGSGPGEMKNPFMIAVLNDIVFVADPIGRRMVQFDATGKFIGHLILEKGFPNFLQTVGKDKFIGFISRYLQTEKGVYRGFNLVLTDARFRELATLLEYRKKYDPAYNDFLDTFTPYALGKDKIFVAENSEERYKINVFDFSGQLLYSIEKEYSKKSFSRGELDELNGTLEKVIKKFGQPDYQPIRAKFKKAVNNMFCDKQGRLLVAASIERDRRNRYDFLVDVFKDGVFLKQVNLEITRGYDFLKMYDEKIFFKNSRIYYIDETASVVKVFEY